MGGSVPTFESDGSSKKRHRGLFFSLWGKVSLTDMGYTSAGGVSGSMIDLGDVNGDGLLDIVAITQSSGEADLDCNGVVAIGDLLILISNWGLCST